MSHEGSKGNVVGALETNTHDPAPVSSNAGNEVVEIVEGKVEKVSVSKHPEASIPQTELSLADIQRSQSHPVRWAVFFTALFLAIIAPYWIGRNLAVDHTARVMRVLGIFAPRGLAFVSWTVTVVLFATVALSIVEEHAWLWRVLMLFVLTVEQLMAGVCLLRFDFWHSTYVVYGERSALPDAVNLGIVAALFAVAVYAVLFVGLLIGVKRTSPLNVLTRSWAAFLMFFVIEVVALLIVLFGGLLAVV
ncbi:hypothetical protein GA0061078_0928 [Bifidobacterium bohemicum]|uniref:Teichoic acid transporter n=1 Tax=Bifidobacterium bohemicum DSM 22767 TaxID=1437606 RepID=A0A086ZE39_9BIFI|nr:hypothetical protein [Bifidobacterium bohemicum]KFI44789.1 hypothetical protein BBOH_1516 [Bifidobacterium bohemicum DSM 22767]SCB93841.1 hypothetical protein GA0061078_0928 [Bifidobacterium bohemicum]